MDRRAPASDDAGGSFETVHASSLVVGEGGLLLRGASGVGKSSLALALIAGARARGLFSRLVGDDRIRLWAAGGRLLMAPHPRIAGLIERRGIGVTPAAHEPAALVWLVVDLLPEGEMSHGGLRAPAPDALATTLAGIRVPRLILPANAPIFDNGARVLDRLSAM